MQVVVHAPLILRLVPLIVEELFLFAHSCQLPLQLPWTAPRLCDWVLLCLPFASLSASLLEDLVLGQRLAETGKIAFVLCGRDGGGQDRRHVAQHGAFCGRRWEQRLLDLLSVIIARANADIIRNLPARGRYAPSSPSEPPSASSSPQYEVDDDDDDRKENYSPQWEASSPGYD